MKRFMCLSVSIICLILIIISSIECYAEDTKLTNELIYGLDNYMKELLVCSEDLISWKKVNLESSEFKYVNYIGYSIDNSIIILDAIKTVLLLQHNCSNECIDDNYIQSKIDFWQKRVSTDVDLITNYLRGITNPVAIDPCIRARSQIRNAMKYVDKIAALQE